MALSVRRWRFLLLLALFAAPGGSGSLAGETEIPGVFSRRPGGTPADPLLLSLRIARAMKDAKGIARYKSLARQRRLAERRTRGGASGRPPVGQTVTGPHPPAGR